MPVYITRAGDTPANLARRFGLSVRELCRLNALDDPRRLSEGLALYLPEGPGPLRRMELLACPYEPLPAAQRAALLPELSWWAGGGIPTETEEAGTVPLLLKAGWDAAGSWSAERAHALLHDPGTVRELLGELEQGAFRGLYLLLGSVHAFDAAALAALLAALAEGLHAAGRYLLLGLAAEEEALFPAAAAADRVVLLSPSHAPIGALPRPNAPLDTLEERLCRALRSLPAEKLLLGLSGYGTRWRAGQPEPISQLSAVHLAVAAGAALRWDAASGERFFRFTDPLGEVCSVWFQDLRSFRSRVELVESLGLAGLALQPAQRLNAPWLALLRSRWEAALIPL